MFGVPGTHKIRNFNINDPSERDECERVLTAHSDSGRVLSTTPMHTKEGTFFMAVHWIEPVKEKDYRD